MKYIWLSMSLVMVLSCSTDDATVTQATSKTKPVVAPSVKKESKKTTAMAKKLVAEPQKRAKKRLKLPPLDPPPRLPSRYNAPVGLKVGPEDAPPIGQTARVESTGPRTNKDFEEIAKSTVEGKESKTEGAPPIQRLKNGRVAVGRIIVDREKKQVEVPAQVAMTQGILEYFAVGPLGKAYESVLTNQGLPSQVHLGMLLIGLTPRKRGGSPVELWIEWDEQRGKRKVKKRVRAEDLMLHRNLKKSPPPRVWRFYGSSFWNGRYSGDSSHTLISLIQDPNAVIVLEDDAGNPYRGDHLGYEVFKENIATRQTPVTIIIKPAETK
mgnify:CR=1 FL=1